MLREQISRIKARDIVVSISFSPYAEETVMVSETAASVGARQIVITDSQISPLATFSDLCFVVKEAQVDAFRSQSATLCLVQLLVVDIWRIGWEKGNKGIGLNAFLNHKRLDLSGIKCEKNFMGEIRLVRILSGWTG